MLAQDIPWFDKQELAALPHEVVGDLEGIIVSVGLPMCNMVQDVGLAFFAVAGAFVACWPIALSILILFPLHLVIMGQAKKGFIKTFSAMFQAMRSGAAAAEECIGGIATVLACGGQQYELQRFEQSVMGMYLATRSSSLQMALTQSLLGSVNQMILYVGFLVGAVVIQIDLKDIWTGDSYGMINILIPVLSILIAIGPLAGLAGQQKSITEFQASSGKVLKLHEQAEFLKSYKESLGKLERFEGLSMTDIHFGY
eukprot:3805163-Amphidinium_carterae.1